MTRALAAALLAALLLVPAAGTHGIKEGGTFRVAVVVGNVDTIDPALVNISGEADLLEPACATLMAYPNKPGPAGRRLTPDLAEGEPVISRNGRTYTFTIREDARFSDGRPVTARAFARALERELAPSMEAAPEPGWLDVAGARDVVEGKAATPRGVTARGRSLTITFTKRRPDVPELVGLLCAVTPALPADPEGASAPLHSPAPYYVAEYVPGERLVLARNRFYRGKRPQHVDRFAVNLAVDIGSAAKLVASGAFDTLIAVTPLYDSAADLAKEYGVNRSRFFVQPGNGLRVFVINTSRPLFRKNPKLRQAVNFAVNRQALAREAGAYGETPADQFLVPGSPGFRDERIYPLRGPNLRRAKELARGRTRGGKAVLYTTSSTLDVSQAQILQQNLKAIGIELEVRSVPALFERLATPGEPFDFGRLRLFGRITPTSLHNLFDGRTIGQPGFGNWSYFDSPKYNRLLDEASRLTGSARDEAYGRLDVQLSRDAAPMIPVSRLYALALVSERVPRNCVVMNPNLDLTAVCLK